MRLDGLQQLIEDFRCAADDIAGIEIVAFPRQVTHESAGFLDQQRAGCHVPGGEAEFPEAIDATGCEVGQVERSRAGTAYARTATGHLLENGEIGVDMIEHAIGETGAEQGLFEFGALADADALVVEEGARALACGKQFVAVRVKNHRMRQHTLVGERDGHGILWKAMDEVCRAVERIDDPQEFGVGFVAARLFGQDAVAGIDFAQGFDDGRFGGAVDLGDEVVLLLDADLDLAEVEAGAADHAAGAAGGLDGRIEHVVHGGGLLLGKSMNSKPSAMPVPESIRRFRVVLSHPSHPGNIGAAARAMKTMGFSRLVLVNPKIFPDAQAEAMASGAGDVLASAQVVGSLAEALHGTILALGMTARRRDLATEPRWARQGAAELAAEAAQGEVALVFGNETSGLSNEELSLCARWAMIPANPEYTSLNLAAAVQLMCYELRLALIAAPLLQGEPACAVSPAPTFHKIGTSATHDAVEGLMAQLESAAVDSGFLDPENPRRLMLRLRRLFGRAGLEKEEVNILRGLLASFLQPTGKRHRPTGD